MPEGGPSVFISVPATHAAKPDRVTRMKLIVHSPHGGLDRARAAVVAAGHELVIAETVSAVEAAFADDGPPDAAILADPSAIDAVRAAAGKRPTWVAAWVDSDHDAYEALNAGADDVFVGALDGPTVARRLSLGARKLAQDRTLRRLKYLARNPVLRDPMTGALRPGVLLLQADHAAARAARTGAGVAMVALEAVAVGLPPSTDLSPLIMRRVLPQLRPGDAVSISSEKTLLLLLDGCTPAEAIQVAGRVLTAVKQLPESGSGVAFEAAAGLATQGPGEPARPARQLLDAAGGALAQAWMSNAERVVVASPGGERQRPARR